MKRTRCVTTMAIAAGLLAVGAAESSAQWQGQTRGARSSDATSFRLYGAAGWAPFELDALNARLASLPEPYSPVGEDMVVLGIGGHGRLNRILLGAEGNVFISTESADFAEDRRATFSAFAASFMVGLSLIATDGFDFYPLIQGGGAGASLEVVERGEPTWDEMLANPGQKTVLSSFTFYGAAGVGMDYAFRNGFFLGARGTWAVTPDADNWYSESGDVLGGPEVNLSGPNVRLLVGFGGRGR